MLDSVLVYFPLAVVKKTKPNPNISNLMRKGFLTQDSRLQPPSECMLLLRSPSPSYTVQDPSQGMVASVMGGSLTSV